MSEGTLGFGLNSRKENENTVHVSECQLQPSPRIAAVSEDVTGPPDRHKTVGRLLLTDRIQAQIKHCVLAGSTLATTGPTVSTGHLHSPGLCELLNKRQRAKRCHRHQPNTHLSQILRVVTVSTKTLTQEGGTGEHLNASFQRPCVSIWTICDCLR